MLLNNKRTISYDAMSISTYDPDVACGSLPHPSHRRGRAGVSRDRQKLTGYLPHIHGTADILMNFPTR